MPVKTTSRHFPRLVVPLLSLLRSHRTFPRTRIVRRKRLRDLNLDTCITGETRTTVARAPGRNPTSTSLILSCDSPPRSIDASPEAESHPMRRDECLMCTHIFARATRARGFPTPWAGTKENSRGDLKLFAQAHSPSAGRSDATIPLPECEPLVNN